MALDKVVDSSVLDAGMASVADAIRAKAGTADPLVWPDGFAAAVEAISSGGGDQVEKGSFVADSTGNIMIPCPFEPDVILIQREEAVNTDGDLMGIYFIGIIKDWMSAGQYISADGATSTMNGGYSFKQSGYAFNLSYNDGLITGIAYLNGRRLLPGYTYNYIFGRCGL